MTGTHVVREALSNVTSPVVAAELAAEAVRALNRLTIATPMPGSDGWGDIGDLYRELGDVRLLVERLPQARGMT